MMPVNVHKSTSGCRCSKWVVPFARITTPELRAQCRHIGKEVCYHKWIFLACWLVLILKSFCGFLRCANHTVETRRPLGLIRRISWLPRQALPPPRRKDVTVGNAQKLCCEEFGFLCTISSGRFSFSHHLVFSFDEQVKPSSRSCLSDRD